MSLSKNIKDIPQVAGQTDRLITDSPNPASKTTAGKKDKSVLIYDRSVTYYDVCGHFKPVALAPIIAVVISVLLTLFLGMKIAVEFKGGTLLTYSVSAAETVPAPGTSDVKSLVEGAGYGSVNVTKGTSFATKAETLNISFVSEEGLTAERQTELTAKLKEAFPQADLSLLNSQDVNPSSGQMFFLKCLVAVILSFIILIIYIAARFKNIGGAPAGFFAVLGIFNDVIFVFAAFTVFRFSIDANFMAVSLTVLGYSINNTIVVYDRVRENKNLYGSQVSLRELVNMSVRQSFTRSLNTTLTSVLALVVISVVSLIFGVTSMLSFATPMVIGFTAGFFSSLYLTGPLWVWYEEKYGESDRRRKRAKNIKNLKKA